MWTCKELLSSSMIIISQQYYKGDIKQNAFVWVSISLWETKMETWLFKSISPEKCNYWATRLIATLTNKASRQL